MRSNEKKDLIDCRVGTIDIIAKASNVKYSDKVECAQCAHVIIYSKITYIILVL